MGGSSTTTFDHTLVEAKTSAEKDIQVDFKQVAYVRRVAKWSLAIAITLHLVSAIAFYSLAATGITVIGYISSGGVWSKVVVKDPPQTPPSRKGGLRKPPFLRGVWGDPATGRAARTFNCF
ncbi:MAG: hypothetical protein AB4352_10320 [Hormoscilla sp.]